MAVQTEGTAVPQVQPTSIAQVLLHPSPATKLLSSHASPTTFIPSPQIAVHTLGEAEVQVYPITEAEQSARHFPTPPSSQTSGRMTSPSPHIGVQTDGFPGAQVYPGSTVQVFEQPSIDADKALSHSSVPVLIKSPHVSVQVVAVVGEPPEHVYPGAEPEQSPKQSVNPIRSPSSQVSDVILRPSPQIAEQTLGSEETIHENPVLISQTNEHPSISTAFPSSQSSPLVLTAFPQTSEQRVGEVIVPPEQTHPFASAEQSA